jgi:hypothetical protein
MYVRIQEVKGEVVSLRKRQSKCRPCAKNAFIHRGRLVAAEKTVLALPAVVRVAALLLVRVLGHGDGHGDDVDLDFVLDAGADVRRGRLLGTGGRNS